MKTKFDDTENEALSIARVSVSVTDLRVGNWIMDRGNKVWQIDCWENGNKVAAKEPIIGFCDFTKKPMHGHPLTEDVNFLKPIPITKEWLLKFGFIEVDYAGGCYQKEDITIDMADFNCCYKRDWLEINVKYIHQLQNLYHALNGSDLQVGSITEH